MKHGSLRRSIPQSAVIRVVAGLLAGLGGGAMLASPVVKWGGNYVDATQALQGGAPLDQVFYPGINVDAGEAGGDLLADDSRMGRLFSTTTPFSPGAPYPLPGAVSPTFYGGAMSDIRDHTTPADAFEQMELQN